MGCSSWSVRHHLPDSVTHLLLCKSYSGARGGGPRGDRSISISLIASLLLLPIRGEKPLQNVFVLFVILDKADNELQLLNRVYCLPRPRL